VFVGSSRRKINTWITATFEPPKHPSVWVVVEFKWRAAAAGLNPSACGAHDCPLACQPSFFVTDMYGIRHLRVYDYVSVSKCFTWLARESQVYPRCPLMIKSKLEHVSIPYDHCQVTHNYKFD